MVYILIAILIFGVLIAVHEFGQRIFHRHGPAAFP